VYWYFVRFFPFKNSNDYLSTDSAMTGVTPAKSGNRTVLYRGWIGGNEGNIFVSGDLGGGGKSGYNRVVG